MSLNLGFASFNIAGTYDAPKTAAYEATPEDCVIFVDPSGGAFTVTLPTKGLAQPGKPYIIVNVTTNTTAVTVATEGSELINGAATVTLDNSRAALLVISDGNNDAVAVQMEIPS